MAELSRVNKAAFIATVMCLGVLGKCSSSEDEDCSVTITVVADVHRSLDGEIVYGPPRTNLTPGQGHNRAIRVQPLTPDPSQDLLRKAPPSPAHTLTPPSKDSDYPEHNEQFPFHPSRPPKASTFNMDMPDVSTHQPSDLSLPTVVVGAAFLVLSGIVLYMGVWTR
ncbi:hypothetical protein NEDG_02017 [Nematocida displodere]|uniref:Uncharacterized protein n=1 Tax=Nematocida displodere TaxID=1805483 RepID=A0A177EET6_9MICR|nr:hypothetical protein NEDG_02017 [Nematocida displodere]